jgi:hypothetical protein
METNDCLQLNKNGKRCSKVALRNHPVHPGFCKFHITRFETEKDVPNSVPENFQNNNIPVLPVDVINQPVDQRILMFLVEFQEEVVFPAIGRNPQDQDMILFDAIITLPIEEQNFLITHYERLVELLHAEIERVQREGPNEQLAPRRIIIGQEDLGFMQRLLQFLGVQHPQRNVIPQNEGDLARFAKDAQNVHTSKTVEMVLETSKKLMKLSKEKDKDLDTMAYCFTKCKLSDKARQQMALMYYSDVSIYDLKPPTYRLVMDGIWVYINSQKEDLQNEIIFRLAQELEDNVGMCAQGNLSRLVNVLSGYMPGVGFSNEKSLQDQMLELREIKDSKERHSKVLSLCKKFKQNEEETNAWLELLCEE